MPIQTDYLPAERLPRSRILGQARQVGESPALIAMLDTTPGMLALLNLERQIIFCNEACAKAGGLERKEDALGMRPGELLRCIHATDSPGGCGTGASCRFCGLMQALVIGQQGRANSGECLMQCNGDQRDVFAEFAVEVKPLPQLGAGWQCYSLEDISDEKRREALERTFFHDILNRAGAVQSISSILADDDMPPRERASFTGMLTVSAHALVDEIRGQRTLLAAERGDLAVESTGCVSLELLTHAADACRSFGIAEAKRVVIEPGAQSIPVHTDATLLGRVLINLFKNALEASAAGTIVTATCTVPEPGLVRYSIHSGAVMPDHVRAHIFQRSFSTKGSGRGLGTYSVKLLTEGYLGGRAWFESATAHGTTFHVELPA